MWLIVSGSEKNVINVISLYKRDFLAKISVFEKNRVRLIHVFKNENCYLKTLVKIRVSEKVC